MKEVLYKTVKHFFPKFSDWVSSAKDPRQKWKTIYPFSYLIWTGMLLFLTRLESRRRIKFLFSKKEFIQNVNMLSDTKMDEMSHPDTLGYLLGRASPEELSLIRVKMIRQLIRMRVLEKYRLFGKYYVIAIDGTGQLTFKKRHCPNCLVQKRKDKTIYYYHNVLEAKLVTANGMALSIETEPIDNQGRKAEDKQDCELKAFYRLAQRLKKYFPQLPICVTMDSLYGGKGVFEICEKNNWKYIITFKSGHMPDIYREYESLKKLHPKNTAKVKKEEVMQSYNWVNEIDYDPYILNVLECNESKVEHGEIKNTKFVWISNFNVDDYNFTEIAKGGRMRWKIENQGFNIQKNGGYNLEHAYSHNTVAIFNFYLLLQIAHIISQLMEKGSLLKDQLHKVFGSLYDTATILLEELRTKSTSRMYLRKLLGKPFQIRFDSS